MEILIMVASSGNNQKLALKLQEIANKSCKTKLINLVDLKLPLYSTKEEEANGIPEIAKSLALDIINHKAFICVAPEYNGVMPPVLNNAIDWTSRATKQWREAFNEKIVALATHSGAGGAKGLNAMRAMFGHLGANVLTREILTTYEKPLNEETAENIISQLIKLS